jgi:3-hydroxymyristoyl/3-hydroxydecanoyl-(acyl carrier protein) dehydratase
MRDFDFGEPRREGEETIVPFTVPADLAYFEGHFPGAPIVPGVAQIVALAEARARVQWPDLGPSRGLRRVKFKKGLYPGDALELRLRREGETVRFTIQGEALHTKGSLLFG